jgi:hypothetical protein
VRAAAIIFALIAACVPSTRSIQHALLDEGYDEIHVLGWAPSCAPDRGAYFEATTASGGVVTGTVCCARIEYRCTVSVTAVAAGSATAL